MHYCMVLGEGNLRVSPAAYLAALRLAISNLDCRFSQSFRDPRGWRRSYTGREIVAEHYDMLHSRWAAWNVIPGHGNGNRARKRRVAIERANKECRWCGQKTGGDDFCDQSCRQSYY